MKFPAVLFAMICTTLAISMNSRAESCGSLSEIDGILKTAIQSIQATDTRPNETAKYPLLVRFEISNPSIEDMKFQPGETSLIYRKRLLAAQEQKVKTASAVIVHFMNSKNFQDMQPQPMVRLPAIVISSTLMELKAILDASNACEIPKIVSAITNVNVTQ